MKKRILAAALALCLTLGLLPMSALAVSVTGTDGKTAVVSDAPVGELDGKSAYSVAFEGDNDQYYTFAPVTADTDSFIYYRFSDLSTPLTFTVSKTEEKVTVTFYVNAPAGATAPAAPASQEIARGGVLESVPTLTLAGYIFKGWAETADGAVIDGLAEKVFTADADLYAVWEKTETPAAKTCITVKNSEEEAGMELEITLTDNTFAAPEKPESFGRPSGVDKEAVFAGWNQVQADGTRTFVKVGDVLDYSEDLVLVAVWAVPEVDVNEDLTETDSSGNKVITEDVLADKVAAAVETADSSEGGATVSITVTSATRLTVTRESAALLAENRTSLTLTTSNGAAVVVNADMAGKLVGKMLPVPAPVTLPATAAGAADKLGGSRLTSAILSGIRSITEFSVESGIFSAPNSIDTIITIPVTVGRDNFVLVHLGTMVKLPASRITFSDDGKFARCRVNHFSCYAEADGSNEAIQALAEEGAGQPRPPVDDVKDLTLTETPDKTGYTIDLSDIDGARYIVYQTTRGKVHAINWNELTDTSSTTVGKGNGESVRVWVLKAAPAFRSDGTFDDATSANILATNKDSK